ncbi:hypothetical protein [Cupriavidus sp. UME77]|uniref:hypothetical protein n=1 Tax=Cupriavidus sp. UME77 TaxID=1862321 RepID=UPI0016014109|nr:hypothetical protein [Cupriavidus sp. UME77]
MRMIDRLLLVPLVLASCCVFAEDSTIAFAPTPATRAVLRVDGHSVTFDIVDLEKGVHRGIIDLETENPIHIAIDDYSFDGRNGFSIWSVDEGWVFIQLIGFFFIQLVNLRLWKRTRRVGVSLST